MEDNQNGFHIGSGLLEI